MRNQVARWNTHDLSMHKFKMLEIFWFSVLVRNNTCNRYAESSRSEAMHCTYISHEYFIRPKRLEQRLFLALRNGTITAALRNRYPGGGTTIVAATQMHLTINYSPGVARSRKTFWCRRCRLRCGVALNSARLRRSLTAIRSFCSHEQPRTTEAALEIAELMPGALNL